MQSVIEKIKNANSIALLTHINEDPDTLGSCFAFKRMMEKIGKQAVIYVSGPIESRLAFIGSDYIVIDDCKDIRHDLCVCLDCGDEGRIGERYAMLAKMGASVNIDHHFTNTYYADVNYVDAKAAAVGEIIYELFKAMDLPLDDETARCLYIAVSSDTGSFKYSNTTPKTMRIAADLLEFNFDHSEIARLLFDSEAIESAKLKAEITSNIKSYADGKIKAVITDEAIGEKYGIDKKDIPNLVDIPRRIEGTEIAVCIKRTDNGFRINLRSNGESDVSAAASELGGGGHVKAAGALLHCDSAEEAEETVIDACKKALGEVCR